MPVQEFDRLDGAVNLSVIGNATLEEFALSRVDCTRFQMIPVIEQNVNNVFSLWLINVHDQSFILQMYNKKYLGRDTGQNYHYRSWGFRFST